MPDRITVPGLLGAMLTTTTVVGNSALSVTTLVFTQNNAFFVPSVPPSLGYPVGG